jgi:hypothetical protein
MEKRTRPQQKHRSSDDKGQGRIPRLFNLEIKDLVHPITIRRLRLLQASVILALVIAGGVIAWQTLFRAPTGAEMLDKMVRAAGGMDAWNNIRHGHFTRTHTLFSESGEIIRTKAETFFFKKTNSGVRLMVRSVTENGEEVWVGKDEDGYWASRDKRAVDPILTARGLGMMCESEFCEPLCASSMAFYRFSMPFKLTDPGVRPQNGGTALLSGEEHQVLDITFDPEVGRDHWVFYIHPRDHLIRKIEYHHSTDEGDSHPEEIFWSDHHEEYGIIFSHKWSRYWSNGKVMEQYVFSGADFETELPDEFFQRSPDHDITLIRSKEALLRGG